VDSRRVFGAQAGWTKGILAFKMQLLGCYTARKVIGNLKLVVQLSKG